MNAWYYVVYRHVLNLVLCAVPLTVLAGFVAAHRHPDTRFSRAWVAVFSGLVAVGALVANFADLLD